VVHVRGVGEAVSGVHSISVSMIEKTSKSEKAIKVKTHREDVSSAFGVFKLDDVVVHAERAGVVIRICEGLYTYYLL
jgi:hypothetical protein